jgi:hypothetical protein
MVMTLLTVLLTKQKIVFLNNFFLVDSMTVLILIHYDCCKKRVIYTCMHIYKKLALCTVIRSALILLRKSKKLQSGLRSYGHYEK